MQTSIQPSFVTSRDNPLIKDIRKLASDATAYRKHGRVWLEGDHLCRAALVRGLQPIMAVFAQSTWPMAAGQLALGATPVVVVADKVFNEISGLESPAPMGFVLALPQLPSLVPQAHSVILDRVQDAGNVGSILRSAAAFGFSQVLALKGTAALWSPKVLRSGMGAHFGLNLIESLDLSALSALTSPLVVTSSHTGTLLEDQVLPKPCAWVMGHEGQGVCAELLACAAISVRIGQPGGEESLNVAAAAAICLHASAVGRR